MLGSYVSSGIKTCEKKRFSDIGEKTTLGKLLYPLVDNKCLFQKDGKFNTKESITRREAIIAIMDYYDIDPAN